MSVYSNGDNQNPPTHTHKNGLKEIRGNEEEKKPEALEEKKREGKQTKLYHQDR